jgi:hypothetical protein
VLAASIIRAMSTEPSDIFGGRNVQYGENRVNVREVYEWLKDSKEGRMSVDTVGSVRQRLRRMFK